MFVHMEETMSQPDPEKALAQLYMYIMENQKHIRALSESAQFMALRRQMGEKVKNVDKSCRIDLRLGYFAVLAAFYV